MPHQHLKALTVLALTHCFQSPQKSHQSVLLHAKGRGRAAKYHERRDAEQKYATRLLGLLTHERKEEERVAKERLEKWSDKRLEDAGLSLTGVRCARLPRGLYGRPARYYDQMLALFATGVREGRFRFRADGSLIPAWETS